MRASVAVEAAGIPTVSVVCEGFEGQARATGRGMGYDGMPLAVMEGHVDSQTADEMLAAFSDVTVQQIVDGLTTPIARADSEAAEPTALDVVAAGTVDEVNRTFIENGWTDGLPVIPPTRDRVEAFIAKWDRDPWKTLGIARPSGRDVTIWSIAVNAVMAGCSPKYLPVLIALAEVLVDPAYGVEHSGNTTGADALVVFNGPAAAGLGFNAGQGALRDGYHANTSVGRWLRLYLRNVCGFTPTEHDKATFGNTFRVVLAEDEEALAEIGWPPLSADFGYASGDDVVTMVRINSGAIVGSVFGATPEEMVPYLADGLARISGWDLTHVYGLGQGHYRPLLVLSPILARTLARAGWSKDDLRQSLFQHARIPAWRFEKLIGDWSNLTAGRRSLVDLAKAGHVPPVFAASDDPNRLVPIVTDPSKFLIAVAGDPHRTNAYVMSNDGPHGYWTSKPVDRSTATELLCLIDGHEACRVDGAPSHA